jgi:peroxiredoxin
MAAHPGVGDSAPDFTLDDTDDVPVTLSQFRGRRVFLAFHRGFI